MVRDKVRVTIGLVYPFPFPSSVSLAVKEERRLRGAQYPVCRRRLNIPCSTARALNLLNAISDSNRNCDPAPASGAIDFPACLGRVEVYRISRCESVGACAHGLSEQSPPVRPSVCRFLLINASPMLTPAGRMLRYVDFKTLLRCMWIRYYTSRCVETYQHTVTD